MNLKKKQRCKFELQHGGNFKKLPRGNVHLISLYHYYAGGTSTHAIQITRLGVADRYLLIARSPHMTFVDRRTSTPSGPVHYFLS